MQTTPGPSIVLPLKWGMRELPGPAGRDPGVDFCVVFTAQSAQTLAAPRRGEGLSSLNYKQPKQPRKSRPRDPSRPAPGALLFPILGEAPLRDLQTIRRNDVAFGRARPRSDEARSSPLRSDALSSCNRRLPEGLAERGLVI